MPTRKSSSGQQPFQLGDRNFVGIDTYTAPNRLLDGYFQDLQNMMVYGNALQPRNGWSTCWHSTTGDFNNRLGAVYVSMPKRFRTSTLRAPSMSPVVVLFSVFIARAYLRHPL